MFPKHIYWVHIIWKAVRLKMGTVIHMSEQWTYIFEYLFLCFRLVAENMKTLILIFVWDTNSIFYVAMCYIQHLTDWRKFVNWYNFRICFAESLECLECLRWYWVDLILFSQTGKHFKVRAHFFFLYSQNIFFTLIWMRKFN